MSKKCIVNEIYHLDNMFISISETYLAPITEASEHLTIFNVFIRSIPLQGSKMLLAPFYR